MLFTRPFLKLPIRFDPDTLEREVRALPSSSWVPHPTGFVGNEAVRLVTVGGGPTDGFEGPMRPTENLARCPYIREIMAELGGVWSRSRLMGLGPGADVPRHVDIHYHWRTHLRIHIPVITDAKVEFTCADETVHMAAGECWTFDSFRAHRVHNGWTERRVHLVLDTIVTEPLRELLAGAQDSNVREPKYLAPGSAPEHPLRFEAFNVPRIMSPWEVRCHIAFISEQAVPHPRLDAVLECLNRFAEDWAAVWAQFGPNDSGVPEYRQILEKCRAEVFRLAGDEIKLSNTARLSEVAESLVFSTALAASLTAKNSPAVGAAQRLAS